MNLSNYILEFTDGTPADDHTYDTFDEAKRAAGEASEANAGLTVRVIEQEFEYADSSWVWDTAAGVA